MTKKLSVKILLEHKIEKPIIEEVILTMDGSFQDIDKKVQKYVDLLNCDSDRVKLLSIENYSEQISYNSEVGVVEVYSEYL